MVVENSKVRMTVLGKQRSVFVGERRSDGSFNARLRDPVTESSIRGTLRVTKNGLRFKATNPQNVWW